MPQYVKIIKDAVNEVLRSVTASIVYKETERVLGWTLTFPDGTNTKAYITFCGFLRFGSGDYEFLKVEVPKSHQGDCLRPLKIFEAINIAFQTKKPEVPHPDKLLLEPNISIF